jgi:peptidoglycan/xylan/chitin deacetylase (PgdA/CDA1 family)
MVKFFASSFTVLLLTITAVKAQFNPALYPNPIEVPPTTSPEVQAWLKEIDLTGAPAIPPRNPRYNFPEPCNSFPDPSERKWPCPDCADEDITECGIPNTWGLTFDGGPSPFTPTLLDYLKTSKISATFFVLGSNVIRFSDPLKREVAEGHHLGSYAWSRNALTSLTNEQIVAEMKWTEKAVMDLTGFRLKYMRPPFGDIDARVRFVLKKLGYIPVKWTNRDFDTEDWMIGTKFYDLMTTEEDSLYSFNQTLNAYVTSPKTKGFYCIEHDVRKYEVQAAPKMIYLGVEHKIDFSTVAGCESDAHPYQTGSTAPMPALPGANTPNGGSSTGPNIGSSMATSGLFTAAAALILV